LVRVCIGKDEAEREASLRVQGGGVDQVVTWGAYPMGRRIVRSGVAIHTKEAENAKLFTFIWVRQKSFTRGINCAIMVV
jgi:hypothetical protein